jgi:hypothetical protein
MLKIAGENEETTSNSLLIAILVWADYDFGACLHKRV